MCSVQSCIGEEGYDDDDDDDDDGDDDDDYDETYAHTIVQSLH